MIEYILLRLILIIEEKIVVFQSKCSLREFWPLGDANSMLSGL